MCDREVKKNMKRVLMRLYITTTEGLLVIIIDPCVHRSVLCTVIERNVKHNTPYCTTYCTALQPYATHTLFEYA